MVDVLEKKESASQQFLDANQYSVEGVRQYERIFGDNFVSTGGLATTAKFVKLLDLKPGMRVLDVGCGIGGSAFHMAQEYGVDVHGIDLSKNMLSIARKSASRMRFPRSLVTFELCDATEIEFPEASFDLIYSRDAIMHIYDKLSLFKRFNKWLKPGGRVFISDYCSGQPPYSDEFQAYIRQREYHCPTVRQYEQTLQAAGFVNVIAKDNSIDFIRVLQRELKAFAEPKTKAAFIKEFSEAAYNHHVEGWEIKVVRVTNGEQVWGVYYGEKPSASYQNILSRL